MSEFKREEVIRCIYPMYQLYTAPPCCPLFVCTGPCSGSQCIPSWSPFGECWWRAPSWWASAKVRREIANCGQTKKQNCKQNRTINLRLANRWCWFGWRTARQWIQWRGNHLSPQSLHRLGPGLGPLVSAMGKIIIHPKVKQVTLDNIPFLTKQKTAKS